MKVHTQIGYEMLKHSDKKMLKFASVIALEHHERWDGNGYPKGLKGEEKALEYIISEKGTFFEPYLVDLFYENIQAIVAIREVFSDNALGQFSFLKSQIV